VMNRIGNAPGAIDSIYRARGAGVAIRKFAGE